MKFITFIFCMVQLISTDSNSINEPYVQLRFSNDTDLKPVDLKSKYFSESWTFSALLNDSIIVSYSISINDFGNFKERVGGANLFVKLDKSRDYAVNKEFPYSDFFYDDSLQKIGLHVEKPFWIQGSLDSSMQIKFKTGKKDIDYDIDLTLTNIKKGLVNDSTIKFQNDEIYQIKPIIPFATIHGTIAIDGDTLDVIGFGNLEHSYQNFNSTKVLKKQVRVFNLDGDNYNYVNIIFGNHALDRKIYGYIQTEKNNYTKQYHIETIVPSEPIKIRGVRTYNSLAIGAKDYQTNKADLFEISLYNEVVSTSILDELNFFVKRLAKSFFKAEFINFLSFGSLDGEKATVSGSLVK